MLKVCNNCFKEECNCTNKKIVEIDKLMYPTIKLLNEKGYKTEFCCSGHSNSRLIDIYIMFDKAYLFDAEIFKDKYKINSKYHYDIKHSGSYINLRTSIHFTFFKNKSREDSYYDKIIEEINNDLYKWAKEILSLEDIKKDYHNNYSLVGNGSNKVVYDSYTIEEK